MHKVAPLTKILLTILISIWAMLLGSMPALAFLVACQTLLFILSRVPSSGYKALGSLYFFAALLAIMQYALGATPEFAAVIGLRMAAMTGSFILLFTTTRIQDLTASLVRQLRVPHEYAFLFTAALCFVPDFLTEIEIVQEAQACRGYVLKKSPIKRLMSYLTIVQPLVLRGITRAETMAMSLELRGFGQGRAGGYGANIAFTGLDYLTFATMTLGTVGVVTLRFYS